MNDYLKRLSIAFENGAETGERIARQFDIDCFQIALARYQKRNFGFQVIMELSDLAEQVRAEYKPALQGGPEADVYQHHMDQELSEIIRGNMELIPFSTRYPELKKPNYKGRRKQ